ncbi:DedA family protein [Fibrella sp. HMF5335]|uniref:DedA family protein n=1 Tax=Fibrella rubiginis TaxID=2817060 RepID=A0A939GD83_9BACT|nr:DedA family protein [Fibrella rubiginis]MBO0936957.1 DedA family protein [Fibrella rubiginis]
MSLESIITTYGYPALFFGVILEAEAFLVLGAYLAHRGYFSLPVVIGVAVVASFSATELFFYLGRRYGSAILEKRPNWQKRVARIHAWFTKYGDGLVLGFRAVYGMRLIIPLTIGTSAYSRSRFTLFNAIGALSWGLLIGLAGNGIAHAVEQTFAHLRRHELLAVIVMAAVAATWGLVQWYRRRKLVLPPTNQHHTT